MWNLQGPIRIFSMSAELVVVCVNWTSRGKKNANILRELEVVALFLYSSTLLRVHLTLISSTFAYLYVFFLFLISQWFSTFFPLMYPISFSTFFKSRNLWKIIYFFWQTLKIVLFKALSGIGGTWVEKHCSNGLLLNENSKDFVQRNKEWVEFRFNVTYI